MPEIIFSKKEKSKYFKYHVTVKIVSYFNINENIVLYLFQFITTP